MSGNDASTPWSRYQADLDRPGFVHDPAQERAVRAIQDLYDRLLARPRRRGLPGVLGRFRRQATAQAPRGLYLWGGVGRGKTYLMDRFQECLPETMARRIHFHRFMADVHDRLQAFAGEADPLSRIGADLAAQGRVLCFDEFFVADIADAMILAGLLEAMFANGLTLVTTSNVIPGNLYRDGLQRAKFLPAIALLEAHCEVLQVDGGTDYRLQILSRADIFLVGDPEAETRLRERFVELAPGDWREATTIQVNHRAIEALAVADGIGWFSFETICESARSSADYIELARRFNTVLLSGVPVMGEGTNDPARRFINLVDELYDRNVNLVIAAAAPIEALYDGQRLSFEFQRTVSRLTEMQTHEYLGREHRP